jgi:CRISPR/Cas system Type II protein with McrA/HNH and RuvC-like nuclease domain
MPASKRRQIIRRELLTDHPFCMWCDSPLADETATLEHVIPVSRGGTDARANFVLACAGCNNERGNPEVAAEESTAIRDAWMQKAEPTRRHRQRRESRLRRIAAKEHKKRPAMFRLNIPQLPWHGELVRG